MCWKESLDEANGEIDVDIGDDVQEAIVERIINANESNMMVIKSVPKVLQQWWSKAVTITLTQWLKAKTRREALQAIERWTKLKSTLIRPLRGGNKRRMKGGALKKWENNLKRWIQGDWEAIWKEARLLEDRRKK